MATYREASPEQAELLQSLVDARLLVPSGVAGVLGRGAVFEDVRQAFDAHVTRAIDEDTEALRFPGLIPREHLERVGYLGSFPHLAASVFGFDGTEKEAQGLQERVLDGKPWDDLLSQSDLVLTPAGCYPVYPAVAARGPVPAAGLTVDIGPAPVFRAEPSGDPARMQTFHMRELVRLGSPDTITDWRDGWRDRALELLRGLGLDADFAVAHDPFFGRKGRLMARSQQEQELKFEIQVQIAGPEPTAVASFNYHQDHFATTFGLELEGGGQAHTGCLGFGHERIVIALLSTHGLDPSSWPADVRAALWP